MRPLPKTKSKRLKAVEATEHVIEPVSAMDQPSAPVRRRGRQIGAAVITVLLIGGAALAYTTIGLDTAQQVGADRVTTGIANYTAFSETIPVNATLIPENTVFLDTVEGGRVTQLHIEDGAVVLAGTPLVTLKNADLELQVIGREAQYTQQLSNLAQAQIAFDQSLLRYDRELMDAQ